MGNLMQLLGGLGNLGSLFGMGAAPEAPAADSNSANNQAQLTQQKEEARTQASAALAPQPTINQQRAASVAQFIQTLIAKLNPLKASAEAAAANPTTNEETLKGLLGSLQEATMKSMNDWMSQEAQKQQAQVAVVQPQAPNPTPAVKPDIVTANGQAMEMKPSSAPDTAKQVEELQALMQAVQQLEAMAAAQTPAPTTVVPSTAPAATQPQVTTKAAPQPASVA